MTGPDFLDSYTVNHRKRLLQYHQKFSDTKTKSDLL